MNVARHEQEQNVVAFQIEHDIYYEVIRDIMPGQKSLFLSLSLSFSNPFNVSLSLSFYLFFSLTKAKSFSHTLIHSLYYLTVSFCLYLPPLSIISLCLYFSPSMSLYHTFSLARSTDCNNRTQIFISLTCYTRVTHMLHTSNSRVTYE